MLDLDEIDEKLRAEIEKEVKKKVEVKEFDGKCIHGVEGCTLPHDSPLETGSPAWWMYGLFLAVIIGLVRLVRG